MTPLVVIRPQPGCDATVAAARALGLEAHGFPLFAVRSLAWSPPDPSSFDALLIGSANALRHGGPKLARFEGKPTYAVGEYTATEARAAGLEVVATGAGGLQAVLADLRIEHRRLLRLTGRERVSLLPPVGVRIEERVVYAIAAWPIPDWLAAMLAKEAVVLLHSAEAARHFGAQCDANEIARSNVTIAALGPRIAEAAGQGWAGLASAPAPSDQALLALAQQMCKSLPQ